jgi:hypothetical protein
MFEGIDRLFQMTSRQMQINARSLQVSVAEQRLDGRQVGAVFQ